MTTPRTSAGRLATIAYGLVGCTSCILFFNLFLERTVTCLSYLLRFYHDEKVRRRIEKSIKDAAACRGGDKPITLLVEMPTGYCILSPAAQF
jgi:hypothetical protein